MVSKCSDWVSLCDDIPEDTAPDLFKVLSELTLQHSPESMTASAPPHSPSSSSFSSSSSTSPAVSTSPSSLSSPLSSKALLGSLQALLQNSKEDTRGAEDAHTFPKDFNSLFLQTTSMPTKLLLVKKCVDYPASWKRLADEAEPEVYKAFLDCRRAHFQTPQGDARSYWEVYALLDILQTLEGDDPDRARALISDRLEFHRIWATQGPKKATSFLSRLEKKESGDPRWRNARTEADGMTAMKKALLTLTEEVQPPRSSRPPFQRNDGGRGRDPFHRDEGARGGRGTR